MRYFVSSLGFLLTPLIVSGVLALLQRPKKAQKGRVYLHWGLALIGVIGTVFFMIPTLITAFTDEPLWIPLVFLAFALLGATLLVAWLNCRITYDEDGFTAKNFFGIKRYFTYDQITGIRENVHEDYIYLGKHRVMVDEMAVGGIEFIAFANQKYKKLYSRRIPKMNKTRCDIFNGNIRDAGSFLFVYGALAVLLLGLLIFTVVYVFFLPGNEGNSEMQTACFESCALEEDSLVMKTAEGDVYKIRYVDGDFDAEGIRAVCDGETELTVYYKEITPDDAAPFFSVKAIRQGDRDVFSFAQSNLMHRNEWYPLIIVVALVVLAMAAVFAATVVVGRNPKRYGKRIVRLFFKEMYVVDFDRIEKK